MRPSTFIPRLRFKYGRGSGIPAETECCLLNSDTGLYYYSRLHDYTLVVDFIYDLKQCVL